MKVAKAAAISSLVLLNIYLAWDSAFLRAISPDLFYLVNAPIQWQNMFLYQHLGLDKVSAYAYIVTDLENLALLLILVASVAWLGLGRGKGHALLRSTQVAALCIVSFGVQLWLFDCGEFSMHVTDLQESLNVFPWFSNADMLLTSLLVLATSTLLLNRMWLRTQWARATEGPVPSGIVG